MNEWVGEMSNELVNHLKKFMEERNLTQNEFARLIPMSESGLSSIMSGKTKRPDDDKIQKIATATGKTYLEIRAMVDPYTARELEEHARMYSGVSEQFTPNAEERMLIKEFRKLSEAKRKALITLVLQTHT